MHLQAAAASPPAAATSSGSASTTSARPRTCVLRAAPPSAASAVATSGWYGLRGHLRLPPRPARPPAASDMATFRLLRHASVAISGSLATAAPEHALVHLRLLHPAGRLPFTTAASGCMQHAPVRLRRSATRLKVAGFARLRQALPGAGSPSSDFRPASPSPVFTALPAPPRRPRPASSAPAARPTASPAPPLPLLAPASRSNSSATPAANSCTSPSRPQACINSGEQSSNG
jgi:hypothetical protein